MLPIYSLDENTAANVELWLKGNYDEKTKSEIRLLQQHPKEITDAFYTHLSFGTGGMRGLMGVGTNRMNEYTVRAATQGIANYVNKQPKRSKIPSVFIGFDTRHNSRIFAEEAAKVLAGNEIEVFLTEYISPTPLVSYGCRFKRCTAAIMITASHNPPEYNGYKVYWSDGGQVLPPHDIGIMKEAEMIKDPSQVKIASSIHHPLIQQISEEIESTYIAQGKELQLYPEENKKSGNEVKIVYTSLHGTGIRLAPKMLASWGFSNVSYVEKQIIIDGDFPTAKYPNPEEKSALALGIEQLKKTKSDVLIATDPDADRVGVAVYHENDSVILTGNQVACLCLEHICRALTSQNKMPPKGAFIKTVVTTELFKAICDYYQKPCFNVLTGFKYIAEKIHSWEENPKGYTYIFGGEESYGYLFGMLTRDKDAIIASALISEVTLFGKKQNKTLVDLLHDIYRKYGVFFENLHSVKFEESKEGKEKMSASMMRLRESFPDHINGIEVIAIEDFTTSLKKDLLLGTTEKIPLPFSDVLIFWLKDQTKLVIRPSGTEPKIKLYCGVVNKNDLPIDERLKESEKRAKDYLATLDNLINQGFSRSL